MKVNSKSLKDFQNLKNLQIPTTQLNSIAGGNSTMAIEKIELATEKIETVM